MKPNDADTLRSPFILTVQVSCVPLQAPPQPMKSVPSGTARSVTRWPRLNVPVQVCCSGQLRPPLTEPPDDSTETVRTGSLANVADTDLLSFIVTGQVALRPPQAPPQDCRPFPPDAVARRVIDVPGSTVTEQVPGQLIPPPLTEPPPDTDTVSVCRAPNDADTFLLPSIVRLHAPLPPQLPPQPVKTNPLSGVAVSVTGWFGLYVLVQTPGQLIPPPVTVPLAGDC